MKPSPNKVVDLKNFTLSKDLPVSEDKVSVSKVKEPRFYSSY